MDRRAPLSFARVSSFITLDLDSRNIFPLKFSRVCMVYVYMREGVVRIRERRRRVEMLELYSWSERVASGKEISRVLAQTNLSQYPDVFWSLAQQVTTGTVSDPYRFRSPLSRH